jgi:ubiquinone/menaquinone biosynthesis C-methylase UbiE
MAKFHFVEDYERYVAQLIATHPIDEAMSLAVGGDYERVGKIEAAILKSFGLKEGMHLVDLGCGSGRLAVVLYNSIEITFTGTDVVAALLDYAASKAPKYQFVLHQQLSIPAPDASADMVTAFSLFTHLLHAETYLYLEDARRVLKPGGRIIFSFLEFAESGHWAVFESTVDVTRTAAQSHLNTFIERNSIQVWADHLGFEVERFVSGGDTAWDAPALGQATVVLRKPISQS